ncbi:MAG: hypothetical protein A3A86_06510 [Elusimicrobia bacterium RIFCSPLOWO2_01_FULL_60_11]|nr:MAG: hypothetical protein A3A86_06510 [Elusimicrobia bacterium RIFCSPLOWO2_01_FULL_60_11]
MAVKNKDIDILIAEDDKDIAELMTAMLQKQGYSVKVTHNGAKAVQMIGKNSPDLVILDIMMPGMSGTEVLLKIKSTPKTQHIPVLMCSVLNDMDRVEKCFKWGASDYVIKPFDTTRLNRKIQNILSQPPKKA